MATLSSGTIRQLTDAARDKSPVSGLTHNFYRYPARFSPQFAAAAISCFSKPGDVVLDPYMGGGTTIVEAMAAGRRAVGNDLNSLAAFVAKVKTTNLRPHEIEAVRRWVDADVPRLSYRWPRAELLECIDRTKMRNLTLVRSRFISKLVACALTTIRDLPTKNARAFAKCALLRVGQWALDGRKAHTSLVAFRRRLASTSTEMLIALRDFACATKRSHNTARYAPTISTLDAGQIPTLPLFANTGALANLVVTSPPYPGVHILYHRWQVDGRRETPAPYWIAGCNDGQGATFYNFGSRHDSHAHDYFAESLRTLTAIRQVMADNAVIVQMLAFSDPKAHLTRYLENMTLAGFTEMHDNRMRTRRIRREVPSRRWHATSKGRISASKEVLLLHVVNK